MSKFNKLAITLLLAFAGCSAPDVSPRGATRPAYKLLGEQRCVKCGSVFEVYGREQDEFEPTINGYPNCPISEEELKQLIEQMENE